VTKYVRWTDLLATKQFWEECFQALTHYFLDGVKVPKQLLLAAATAWTSS
jgi:hypothetical protein